MCFSTVSISRIRIEYHHNTAINSCGGYTPHSAMASQVMEMFSDSEFEHAFDELDVPDVEGWELFTSFNNVTLYRLFDESSSLYQYKVYGQLQDVSPEICAQVYLDLEYRKLWDNYAKVLELKECEGRSLIYWEVNFPFPLWNRDYLYGRESRVMDKNGQEVWVVLAKSLHSPCVAEKSGIVRVDDYLQSVALCSHGQTGTKAFMRYYDNPKGNIPKWLINWAAKTGVPQFLTMMQAACRTYPQYLEEKKMQQSPEHEKKKTDEH